MKRSIIALGLLLLVTACRSLPVNIEREPSHAFLRPQETFLGTLLASGNTQGALADASGFMAVTAGTEAFLLRSAFAGLAERTLDLQYYIWEDDITGRMLLRDVLNAADRGVRVRLLIDDTHTEGATDLFGIVDAHARVDVRIFNPFAHRELRAMDFASRGLQLNHRMHNKVMVADNALAITGGRNIGDHYFAVDESMNFRDLDLLATGPVVRDLSEMFDTFWNSEWSYPIAALNGKQYAPAYARGLKVFIDEWIAGQSDLPFTLDSDQRAMAARIRGVQDKLAWGAAHVIYDCPDKVTGESGPRVAKFLFDSVDGATRELLIETAYFIPGDSGVAILESLVERGIDVKLLTNSLATNDILPAHAAYMQYREALLRGGIDLYELRPDALAGRQEKSLLSTLSKATLHTKALVYDRTAVFVGSFNLDPRSLLINSEMGVLVENEALASEIAQMMLRGMQPENSYRLVLNDDDVHWKLVTEGGEEILDTEPATSWWHRFLVNVFALLPIDGQL